MLGNRSSTKRVSWDALQNVFLVARGFLFMRPASELVGASVQFREERLVDLQMRVAHEHLDIPMPTDQGNLRQVKPLLE